MNKPLSGGEIDTLIGLVESSHGFLEVGDLPSKAGTHDLIDRGYATFIVVNNVEGEFVAATLKGIEAYMAMYSPCSTIAEAKQNRMNKLRQIAQNHVPHPYDDFRKLVVDAMDVTMAYAKYARMQGLHIQMPPWYFIQDFMVCRVPGNRRIGKSTFVQKELTSPETTVVVDNSKTGYKFDYEVLKRVHSLAGLSLALEDARVRSQIEFLVLDDIPNSKSLPYTLLDNCKKLQLILVLGDA